jgi:CheY-like chemotaxis protein
VNLLANAAKYTPPGGTVRLTLSTEGRSAVIRVSDSGIGIPREMQERIFDLFVQGESKEGETKQGLGVGLTLVRALARLHNGDVTVHSDGEGKGSTFTVRLPMLTTAGKPCPTNDREFSLNGLRLLIVDDNPDIRRMSSRLLEHAGCVVESAVDGEQALEALNENVPDAALIDIGLPGISGYDVAQRIRAKYDGNSPFLVAITGFGQPEDRRKALASGFDAHLVKPINMAQLGELLTPLRQEPRAGRKPAKA